MLVNARSFPGVRGTSPGASSRRRGVTPLTAEALECGQMPGEICTALTGLGMLRSSEGSPLVDGPRDYAIVVWRRQIAVGGETVDGMKRLSGKVRLKGLEGYRLLVRQQTTPVVLILEDGRQLPVVFSGCDGGFCLSRPCPDWVRHL